MVNFFSTKVVNLIKLFQYCRNLADVINKEIKYRSYFLGYVRSIRTKIKGQRITRDNHRLYGCRP